MNSLYSVIKKFIVTSKSTDAELRGVYTCIVDNNATKIDIKNAVSALYGTDVAAVNILYTRPKFHNTRTGVQKKRGIEKKAMITLAQGQRITNLETIQ